MSEEVNEFDDIRPYTDEEAIEALKMLARHPYVPKVSKMILPDMPEDFLCDVLQNLHSIDEFQSLVMSKAVAWVIETTMHNFSYDGFQNITEISGKFLAVSNHRDIILDPAITQYVLFKNNLPMTQIAVGDNLLMNKYIEALIRSNRMIKVIRGISARSLYISSQRLSRYIRQTITSGEGSVWIAQKEGRAKNGVDTTEQGLLKMFDMSGQGSFVENFMELNIVPLSISYEYEPCDILKARELLISRSRKYVKEPYEDLNSIIVGIRQPKGNVHLNFGHPLTEEEVTLASLCQKNDRYQYIRHVLDLRILQGYRIWKSNYMAYDILHHTYKYADLYDNEDIEAFTQYMEGQLDKVEKELNRNDLREIFLSIYANPLSIKMGEKLLF